MQTSSEFESTAWYKKTLSEIRIAISSISKHFKESSHIGTKHNETVDFEPHNINEKEKDINYVSPVLKHDIIQGMEE